MTWVRIILQPLLDGEAEKDRMRYFEYLICEAIWKQVIRHYEWLGLENEIMIRKEKSEMFNMYATEEFEYFLDNGQCLTFKITGSSEYGITEDEKKHLQLAYDHWPELNPENHFEKK